VEIILDMFVWRTDIILPNGVHYYGIMNEIFGIGIALTASGWIWITVFAGLVKLECELFKRNLLISFNKVIFLGIIVFLICFIINKLHIYFYNYNFTRLVMYLVAFSVLIPQIIILLFTNKRVTLKFPK
jgi:hypothetical protein